jgi:O-antigen/teichoic acid export membrane protein
LPVLVALNTVLGMHWAIPFGQDRGFLAAMLSTGSLNLLLALALAPRFGALGVVVALTLAEVIQSLLLLRLRRRARA